MNNNNDPWVKVVFCKEAPNVIRGVIIFATSKEEEEAVKKSYAEKVRTGEMKHGC